MELRTRTCILAVDGGRQVMVTGKVTVGNARVAEVSSPPTYPALFSLMSLWRSLASAVAGA